MMTKKTLLLLVFGFSLIFTPEVFSGESYADKPLVDAAKFKIGGHARVRYEFKNDTDFGSTAACAPTANSDCNDTRDFVLTRVRPYIKFMPHEQVSIMFEPQFSGGWGEREGTVTAVTPFTAATTSGALNDPALGVHQAYIEYSPVDWYTLIMGRQEWAYGDELVVGPVGWHNIGRSFDGVKMRFKGDTYWVDFLWSLLDDAEASLARPNGGISGDAHLVGVYSSFDFGRFLKAVDFYALYRLDQTGGRPTLHNYVTGGFRLKSKPNAWDYRVEVTGQFGKQRNAAGTASANQRDYQFDIEGGYTWEDFYKFRVGLEFFLASLHYNQLFPTAHKWLGYIDLFGRRNIMGGVLHLSMKPAKKWKLNLDAHTIMRTKTSSGLSALAAASGGRIAPAVSIGGAGGSNSRFAGEEIDFVVSYDPLQFLGFKVGASVFLPMGFIKNNIDNEVPVFGWFQTMAKF